MRAEANLSEKLTHGVWSLCSGKFEASNLILGDHILITERSKLARFARSQFEASKSNLILGRGLSLSRTVLALITTFPPQTRPTVQLASSHEKGCCCCCCCCLLRLLVLVLLLLPLLLLLLPPPPPPPPPP